MFPTPHRPSITSEGFAQFGSLNQSGPSIPSCRERVDRPGGGVQEVDEAERRCDRRDRAQAGRRPSGRCRPPARAREHDRDPEREQHLQRNADDDDPERVVDRRPDLVVEPQHVAVVREADPARRAEQVVVRERQVGGHHERVAEEDEKPTIHGLRKARTVRRRRHACPPPRPPAIRRRDQGRGRSPGLCDRRQAHGTPPPPFSACLIFASIVLSTSRRPRLQVLHLPGVPLDEEVRERLEVIRPDRRDRGRGRVRIHEDLQERAEVLVGDELGRDRRALRRRDVPDPVRELRERVVVRRQVLDELPRLVTVLAVLRDADDRPVDVARAVELGLRVVHRHRGRPVCQLGVLVLQERDAPLTVEHHRELAGLEGVRRGELVAGTRLPLHEVVVPVEVDQLFCQVRSLAHPGSVAEVRLAVSCRSRWRR